MARLARSGGNVKLILKCLQLVVRVLKRLIIDPAVILFFPLAAIAMVVWEIAMERLREQKEGE